MSIGIGGGCLCEPHDGCCNCSCHRQVSIAPLPKTVADYGMSFRIPRAMIVDDIYGGVGFPPFMQVIREHHAQEFKDLLELL